MIVGGEDKSIKYDDTKNVTFRSSGQPIQYAIMRIGNKYFNLASVEAFEYHMERLGQVENADATKSHQNRILIGDANIYNNLDQKIKGVWKRKDSAIMRDGILTTSPDFMKNLSEKDLERWLNLNVEWLQKTFKSNCLYAVAHFDETTIHIHYCVSLDYINDKGKSVMSNKHFFGSKEQLSNLQSSYAEFMQDTFKILRRGLKGSKASHISIKKYYNLCAEKLDEKDLESVMAKAKNNELTEIKLNHTNKTLNYYKDQKDDKEKENEVLQQQNIQLWQNLKGMKKDNELYREGIITLSKYYGIPAEKLIDIINYSNKKEKEIEHEL